MRSPWGNAGNDTYIVDNTNDIITETSTVATEIDTVQSSVTHALGNNLENLTLTGTSAINATGNGTNNTIIGNNAANSVNGSAGNDTMTGGAGNDTYVVGSAGDVVDETSDLSTEIDTVWSGVNYTLGNNVERLTLIGTSAINGTGNTLNNTLTGNSAANDISGSAGNDTISGGAGDDTMIGDTGNDTYVVDSTGDVVTETSIVATEIDTIQSGVSYTLGTNVENLTLTGTSVINGTGNSLKNTITGNSAANSINGGAGNDAMTGGTGNDTYVVDTTGDVVTETSVLATEIDTVESGITYTLLANVENLTLTGASAINGTGNNLNNVITGNGAVNGINGGVGNDTMIGGAGNDTYVVNATGDVVTETSTLATEIDTVQSGISYILGANVERLTLIGTSTINGTGNNLNNTVTGNSANNTLFGGIGNDALAGGSNSKFRF